MFKTIKYLLGGAAVTTAMVLIPHAINAQPAAAAPHVWDPERLELHNADRAATEYATNNYGVGIIIHVGDDFPNKYFETADDFGKAVIQAFNNSFDVDAEYFLSSNNDAPVTLLTFHIGHTVHGAENATELKTVKQAAESMENVVGQLRVAKSILEFPSPASPNQYK